MVYVLSIEPVKYTPLKKNSLEISLNDSRQRLKRFNSSSLAADCLDG